MVKRRSFSPMQKLIILQRANYHFGLELECLKGYSQKISKKNLDFLMSQIFGYVKRQTGKEWGDHQTDDEYEAAKKLAFEKLQEVRSEIKKRHGYKDLLDLIE